MLTKEALEEIRARAKRPLHMNIPYNAQWMLEEWRKYGIQAEEDRIALLDHADALERENARLREDNTYLAESLQSLSERADTLQLRIMALEGNTDNHVPPKN